MAMRFNELETLRGYMCLWVIVTHTVTMAALPLYKDVGIGVFLANGRFAVEVFIFLSGFVISLLLASNKESYAKFLRRRFFRLFPVYLVALLLSCLVYSASVDFLQEIKGVHPKFTGRLKVFSAVDENYFENLLAHIFLLHGMIPNSILPYTAYAFIGQAWSLTLELQFYFLAPILLKISNKNIKLDFLVILILSYFELLSRGAMGHSSFIGAYISYFYLGTISCTYFINFKDELISKNDFIRKVVLVIGFSMLIKTVTFGWLSFISYFIWGLVLLSISVGLSGAAGRFYELIFSSSAMSRFGVLSYSAYCLHMIPLYLFGYVYVVVLELDIDFYYSFGMLTLPLLITVFLSSVLNKYVEVPLIRYSKKSRLE